MNWQKLKSDSFETYSAAVPGGWLVLVKNREPDRTLGIGDNASIAFLPDSIHAWDGSDPLAAPLGLRET